MSDSVFQLLQNGAKYFEVEFEIQIYTDSERQTNAKITRYHSDKQPQKAPAKKPLI